MEKSAPFVLETSCSCAIHAWQAEVDLDDPDLISRVVCTEDVAKFYIEYGCYCPICQTPIGLGIEGIGGFLHRISKPKPMVMGDPYPAQDPTVLEVARLLRP